MMQPPARCRGSSGLELDLDAHLEPAAKAALTVDLKRRREEGRAGARLEAEGFLVGLVGEDPQIVRVQEIEDFDEGRGGGATDDEGLAEIEVDLQGGVVALTVAVHGLESPALARVEDRGSEARSELEVILVVQGEEARDDGVGQAGGPGHRRADLP